MSEQNAHETTQQHQEDHQIGGSAFDLIPGGDVTGRTGDEYTGTRHNDLFSMEYEGGLANETR